MGFLQLRARGSSPVVVWGLLPAEASLAVSAGSRRMGSVVAAPRPYSTGTVVVGLGLSSSGACGIFLAQGWNRCSLRWKADS